MDQAEVGARCEELGRLISEGPGDDPIALDRVESIASQFEAAWDQTYIREKARDLVHDFRLWFSPRKWRRYGEGGARLRAQLYADVSKLQDAVGTFGTQ